VLLGDALAVEIMIKAVKEGNAFVRENLIMAIGYSRDRRAVRPLIELFETQEGMNDDIRAVILTALGYIAEEAEVPILKNLSRHYNYLLTKYDALLQIMSLL